VRKPEGDAGNVDKRVELCSKMLRAARLHRAVAHPHFWKPGGKSAARAERVPCQVRSHPSGRELGRSCQGSLPMYRQDHPDTHEPRGYREHRPASGDGLQLAIPPGSGTTPVRAVSAVSAVAIVRSWLPD
jgi:hypothetical protein